MSINSFLVRPKFSKYYYSCIDDIEYIIRVDNIISLENSVVYHKKKGNIILDMLNNTSFFLTTIKKYIKKLNSNSSSNDDITLNLLINLHMDLSKNESFFRFIDFQTLYSNQFYEIKNTINLKKERFNELEKYINNNDFKDFQKNFEREMKFLSSEINTLEEYTFNRLVLEQLNKLVKKLKYFSDLLKHTHFSFVYFNQNAKELNSIENKSIYEFSDIKSYGTFAYLKKDDIIFDLKDFDFKNLFLNEKKDLNNYKYRLIQYFEFNDIIDLINLSFFECINSKVKINHCENCHKYFLPHKRSDEKYCGNASPQDPTQTCRAIGAHERYKNRIKSNEIERLKHNVSVYFSKKRNDKNHIKKRQAEKISEEYNTIFQKYLKQFENKKITEDEFFARIPNHVDFYNSKIKKSL